MGELAAAFSLQILKNWSREETECHKAGRVEVAINRWLLAVQHDRGGSAHGGGAVQPTCTANVRLPPPTATTTSAGRLCGRGGTVMQGPVWLPRVACCFVPTLKPKETRLPEHISGRVAGAHEQKLSKLDSDGTKTNTLNDNITEKPCAIGINITTSKSRGERDPNQNRRENARIKCHSRIPASENAGFPGFHLC